MPVFTLENAQSAFTSTTNLATLGYMVIIIIFWYSARYWQTPDKIRKRVKFFDPKVTQQLQEKFRNPKLDWFTSVFWFWIFGVAVFLMWFICMFQGPEAFRYGIPVVTATSVSMFIQMFYPVVVPIRYADFGKDLPVTIIRFEAMGAGSDKINGLLYNGLPSNHLGMVVTGLWLCVVINIVDPWAGWQVMAVAFVILGLIFMFAVLYLGEHYWQDLIAAIIVYSVVLTATKFILDFFFPISF
jgi:hypothetical protein